MHHAFRGICYRRPVLLALPLALAACESLDRLAFGPEPAPEVASLAVAPLDDDVAYPKVRTVPARPQLSYSIEQQREIVGALISDRENARYTSDAVRYRTGRSSLPPPLAPPPSALVVDDVVDSPPVDPEVLEGTALIDVDEDSSSDDSARTLEQERAQLDDGSLDDFVRNLMDETDSDPGLDTQTAVMDQGAGADVVPGRGPRESAIPDLFRRFVDLFGGEAEAAEQAPEEAGDEDVAPFAAGAGEGGDGDGPPPSPEKPAPGEPGVSESGRDLENRPVLKPDESADPPVPAPEKPGDQAGLPGPAGSLSPAAGFVLYPRASSV